MKRITVLTICVLMLLGVFSGCAVGGNETTAATQLEAAPVLKVGYGRTDISPTESVPLRGYGNTLSRMSDSVTERLYATCVAFTDGNDNTVLLFHLDLCGSGDESILFARAAIARATGIPATQILMTATHTHSAPDLAQNGVPSIVDYKASLKKWLLEAAEAALADRKEAKMYTAAAYPENLNFIRYYNYSDGTIGSGTLPEGAKRVSHYGDCDNEMQLIKFTRDGGKDVLLVNWQGHPHRDGGTKKYNATSDIVGSMRNYLEAEMDCQFAYFTGGSGNVNNHSMIDGITPTKDYLEHGQALGKAAVEAAAEFKEAAIGKVQLLTKTYKADSKEGAAAAIDVPMYVFSLGDVAFVTAPYEMFDTSGLAIKEGSPFEMTFVATCANGSCGYFPTEFAYECPNSYEVGVSRVARGTAEIMEKEYVSLLEELYKTK